MTGSWLQGAIVGYVCLFRGQTNNILEVIKIQVFVIYFITFWYLYIPARPPSAPTRPQPPVDCCENPFLLFFLPRGVFRPSKAARRHRLANIRRRAPGVTFRAPLKPPAPPTRRILPVDCCLSFSWSFVDPEEGEAAVFSNPAPPSNQIFDPGVRVASVTPCTSKMPPTRRLPMVDCCLAFFCGFP